MLTGLSAAAAAAAAGSSPDATCFRLLSDSATVPSGADVEGLLCAALDDLATAAGVASSVVSLKLAAVTGPPTEEMLDTAEVAGSARGLGGDAPAAAAAATVLVMVAAYLN